MYYNNTDLTQQLGQPKHLSYEHSQADQDGVELANETSDILWRNFAQVHGEGAESYTCEEKKTTHYNHAMGLAMERTKD